VADVKYGERPRNVMDIYSPCAANDVSRSGASDSDCAKSAHDAPQRAALAPVVLFVHGGVWASGAKWHYAQMATSLAQAGCVVCVMQYSLYPQVNCDCMVRSSMRAMH
jgi:acetyl esterase/lipase